MITVVFTLDYEIHGNGEGDPRELMVEPTNRILQQFDQFKAKLTIMADVAEILRFRAYANANGVDRFHHGAILEQLKRAVGSGHDVQLHLHTSYFNAEFDGTRWAQDYSEYSFANLAPARIAEYIWAGKEYLEQNLPPESAGYSCYAFRAANWSMQPSGPAVAALAGQGFKVDTSVFKHGRRSGLVNFDYSQAPSHLLPWRVSPANVCEQQTDGPLLEAPIYCEKRWLGAFISAPRLQRAMVSRRHPLRPPTGSRGGSQSRARVRKTLVSAARLFRRHAWKADMNQCTGAQLIGALGRAEKVARAAGRSTPFVLIGHSKLFGPSNVASLRPFLKFVSENPSRFRFGTFSGHEEWAPVGA